MSVAHHLLCCMSGQCQNNLDVHMSFFKALQPFFPSQVAAVFAPLITVQASEGSGRRVDSQATLSLGSDLRQDSNPGPQGQLG